MKKRCYLCRCFKDISDFYKNRSTKDGITGYCKPCHNRTRNTWRKAHPEHDKKYREKYKPRQFENHLRHKYGITLDEYNAIYSNQEGRCAICKKHQAELDMRLELDHNHKTKKVRGLLCHVCNTRLAIIENEEFKQAAERYLWNKS